MGRKKKQEGDALRFEVKTHVNQAELDRLRSILGRSRHRNMSALLRAMLSEQAVKIHTVDATLDTAMEEIVRVRKELHAIGHNINQTTRFFHSAPTRGQKQSHLLHIAELYGKVGTHVEKLYPLISELSKRWLQE